MAQKFHTDSPILKFSLNSNFPPPNFTQKSFPQIQNSKKPISKTSKNSQIPYKIIKKIKKIGGDQQTKKNSNYQLISIPRSTP
jgi:hypothetical protein